ncbi:HEAT repeat-containing protein 1 isoform X2 [Protopterus annectens]|uniref:HEAT repeat-containing protein 1 isoform X2 n=1 Tax=Protopterus annectens TaxID=7888 RepID=UPI001CFA3DA5|nr:HEAT repeat-containing protein 1 isoform X2 [Protopterus annectens]
MTSLAQQLKRLALPQNDPSYFSRHQAPSLLFNRKEAAGIDRETFFAIGCTGLEEMIGIDPSFESFQLTLFSLSSKGLERSVQSKEVNQQLDENISLFLTRLSPYFLLKPAQKCLEWLIHRFHIHLYNQDSLIGCILPYHETKIFVRVVQLLKLKDPAHRWHWLYPIQNRGVPLARGTLVTHCYKDLGFLDFICTLVTKAIKAFTEVSSSATQLRVLFSFYASTIVAALDAVNKVTDTLIAKLLPCIQKGLKSVFLDYRAATYMIICQLAVKVVMEASLVNTLAVQISKSLQKSPSLFQEGLGCLTVLLQNQKGDNLGKKPFTYLCNAPDLVTALQRISAEYDVTPLLHYILPSLVCSVLTCTGEDLPDDSSIETHTNLLGSVLERIPLENNLDHKVACALLSEYISCGMQSDADADGLTVLNQRIQPLVRVLERKYPRALDAALAGHVKDVTDHREQALFHQFISLSLSSGKYQFLEDSDTSLFLSLNHPQPAVRLLAVQHLNEIIDASQEGFDSEFLKEAVLERLKDESHEVVMSALKALEAFSETLGPETVVDSILNLVQRVHLSRDENWYDALIEALRILGNGLVLNGNEVLTNRVVMELLPFMVVTNADPKSAEQKLSVYLANSGLHSLHSLLKGWAQVLEKVTRTSKSDEVVGMAYQKLVTVLVNNLTSMESSALSQTVESLAQLAGQKNNIQQKVTFHLVCTVFVECCRVLNEEDHIKTAGKVYNLLEKISRELLSDSTNQDNVPGEWQNKLMEGSMPVQLMTEFVSKLKDGQAANAENAMLMLFILKEFISVLKRPKCLLKAPSWWNPEKLDESGIEYLRLVFGFFNVTVCGAGEGNFALCFRQLMQHFFKVQFSEASDLFKFLAILWSHSHNIDSRLTYTVNAILQTQALYVGRALLESFTTQKKRQVSSTLSTVVVPLVANLGSHVREVRRAALACLEIVSGFKETPFHLIIDKVIHAAEEITADPTYICQAMGNIFAMLQVQSEQKSQRKKLSETLEHVLKCVQDPDCPAYLQRGLLKTFQEVNNEVILAFLLPTMEILLEKVSSDPKDVLKDEALLLQLILGKYNEYSAPLLATDPKSFNLFIKALHTANELYPGIPTFQVIALSQITRGFFAALPSETIQQKLVGVLFDLLVDCKNIQCGQSINCVFKAISVDAEQIALELGPLEKSKPPATVQQTRRQKMQKQQQRTSQETDSTSEASSVNFERATLILELVQHKKKLKRPQILVSPLFNLLSRCLEPQSSEQGNLEYIKQLILSCLLNICQKLSPDGGKISDDILEEDKFNVELIVQCVRTSNMPQTHHHALLLLGAVAGIFPEKVLHNIMPIFTFMGASVMRLDDMYSFQVISKTVQTVIPALIQSDGGGLAETKGDIQNIVTRIIRVFVDAMPHVPEHRRLPVLQQLVSTVGAKQFLWVLLLLLFEQHVTKTASDAASEEKESVLERDTEFWISVSCEFDVQDQIQSLVKILQYLMALPVSKDEDDQGQKKKKQKAKTLDPIFNVESRTGKQLRHFKFLAVSFQSHLLASNYFIGKVAECDVSRQVALQQHEQKLLEETLCYINMVARSVEENANKPTAKFWRALLNKSYEALDKVNALLPTESFVPVIRGLLVNQLPSVRRKAMELLNNKVQHSVQWQEDQVQSFLEMPSELLSIVCNKEKEEEQAINRQTALYSLKLLCKCFGAENQEAFVPVLNTAVDLVLDKTEEKNVLGSALLCIAEVVIALKALAVPQLPRLMPAVLKTLKDRKELLSNEIYLLSAVTALQKVTETLPNFISPYLVDILMQITHLSKIAASSGPSSQLHLRVSSVKTTVATKLASRVLLPVVTKCYNKLEDSHQSRLGPLLDILKENIVHMEKEQLNAHQSELTTFFLKALDFRADHSEDDLRKVGDIEEHIINCVVVMVMKLSEVTFRPLFFKLFDWAKTEDSSRDRLLTFYRLADCIADKLKGLFILFAGHLVKPFADLLKQSNAAKSDEPLFEEKNSEKTCLLLQFVMDCLHKIFLYDTQHFVNKERAEALMTPLVDQLENVIGGEDAYQERVTNHLIPCIAQFSVAIGDDSLWKPLNYQILLKMRHSSSKIRLAALMALLELAGKLKENYMILLPESIPFLAELMEDECEEVEHQCQKVIQQLEVILGESLQSYF